ncbi:hypothetical protein A8M77_15900 [Variovorax sp. JS1663]|nr:hypothetical protein A8M77_15900 [Variovorax sp. JS1663]
MRRPASRAMFIVACRALAVDVDHQLGEVAEPVDLAAEHAGHLLDLVLDGFCDPAQHGQVVARHLDHDLAVDLRDRLQHVVAAATMWHPSKRPHMRPGFVSSSVVRRAARLTAC